MGKGKKIDYKIAYMFVYKTKDLSGIEHSFIPTINLINNTKHWDFNELELSKWYISDFIPMIVIENLEAIKFLRDEVFYCDEYVDIYKVGYIPTGFKGKQRFLGKEITAKIVFEQTKKIILLEKYENEVKDGE